MLGVGGVCARIGLKKGAQCVNKSRVYSDAPVEILEVVPRETDIEFGFSAEKRWKLTTWMYFSESGPGSFHCIRLHGRIGGPLGGHVASPEWLAHQARSTEQAR